jgi:hypothetical protein
LRLHGGAGDGAGAQQARVVKRAQSIRLEVNQMNYSNIHYVNLRAEMARGNIGIGQMAKALHISRDTMARKLAAASGRGVPGARSVLSIVQYRSTVPGRKGRARRIKHLAQLVDYFVFLLGRCARALAAAVLLALPVRPSRSTFDAAVAALALVCLELRNVLPPFFGELYAVLVTRHTLNIQHIALNIKQHSIFGIQKVVKTC